MQAFLDQYPALYTCILAVPVFCYFRSTPVFRRQIPTTPTAHDLAKKRAALHDEPIVPSDVSADPAKHFHKWLGDAVSVRASVPAKMSLSTVEIEEDGTIQPCSRMIMFADVIFEGNLHSPSALIRGDDEPARPISEFFNKDNTDEQLLSHLQSRGGFICATNYESNKGKQLAKNPRCALNFLWPELERSVRVSGTAYRVPAALSDMYHEQRPRSSRVAALTSEQSRPVASRASLEERYAALDQQLRAAVPPEGRAADEYVPRPASWGAYVVVPHRMEVWQGRGGRFHERVQVQARAEGEPWEARCLQP